MKKVLVITYYWPPAGGPGVQRVLKFCKYLPEFGWRPTVLTVASGEYPNTDPSLSSDVRSDIGVFRTKSIELYGLFRRLTGRSRIPVFQLSREENEPLMARIGRWVRLNMVVPDARVGWYWSGVKKGREIVRAGDISAIFSSGPPHSLHLIARAVSAGEIPWVADFRDPWTDRYYYEENERWWLASAVDRLLERKTLNSASAVTTVSPGVAELLKASCDDPGKVAVVYNGYDSLDFDFSYELHSDRTVRITHVGSLTKSQCPSVLLQALQRLREDRPDMSFQLNLIGSAHAKIHGELEARNMDTIAKHHGYLPHSEALRKMAESDFLFLVVPNTPQNRGIITGKLFEYMRSGTPIIVIGPSRCDAVTLVKETNSGFGVDYEDVDSLTAILVSRPHLNQKNIRDYDRRELTRKLAAKLDEIV